MVSLNTLQSSNVSTKINQMVDANISRAQKESEASNNISSAAIAASMSPQSPNPSLQVSPTELKIIKEFFIPEINKFKDTKNPDMQMHWQKNIGVNTIEVYPQVD